MSVLASAPASSANLGPGFDVVALALGMRCTVEVDESDAWEVVSEAGGDGDHLVRAAAEAAGAVSPLRVRIGGDVPVGRGLGSSAALIVATVGAVRALAGTSPVDDEVFGAAARVEGHPDNVAAAVHGGLVAVGPAGSVRSLDLHPSLSPLVAVPEAALATAEARAVVAGPVGTALAARNAARLAFLLEGLRTGDAGALAEAAGDELHEVRRAHLAPLSDDLMEAAREAGALHAAWSGAGPSVIAFVVGEQAASEVRRSWEALLGESGGVVLDPGVDRVGLVIEPG
jgi:homoserine kinase